MFGDHPAINANWSRMEFVSQFARYSVRCKSSFIETCINVNLFPDKNKKNRGITISYFRVCSPSDGPSKSFILYTYMVYLHNICNWEAGSRGEHISILDL